MIHVIVFQAYLEFFTCQENVRCLKDVLIDYPSVNYHIIDHTVWLSNHFWLAT